MTTPSCIIDVSHYQGAIDWNQVFASGILHAFLKCTEGTWFSDPTYGVNRVQVGFERSTPYHFLHAGNAEAQAVYFIQHAGLTFGMRSAVDWETDATPDDVVEFGNAIIATTGLSPVVYRGIYQMQAPYLTAAEETILTWPWWLARYAAIPGVDGWLFWQKTMSATVPGINAQVDLSDFAGTETELVAWQAGGNAPPTPTFGHQTS